MLEQKEYQEPKQNEPTTLIDSYHLLCEKMEGLRHLTNISETLIEKMNRTHDRPKDMDGGLKEGVCAIDERNIVGLFNSISKTIDIEGQKIDNNISNAIALID